MGGRAEEGNALLERNVLEAIVRIYVTLKTNPQSNFETLIHNEYNRFYPHSCYNRTEITFTIFSQLSREIWGKHINSLLIFEKNPSFKITKSEYLDQGIFPNLLLVTCIIPPLAALLGLMKDVVEMIQEACKRQRRKTNLVTAFLGGAYLGVLYLFIDSFTTFFTTSPLCWCILVGSAMVAGFALLCKMTRIILNEMVNKVQDCCNRQSLLAKDVRFQLTGEDVASLNDYGASHDYIIYCKKMIEALALLAFNKREYGLFGTKKNYRQLVEMLYEVKQGIIPGFLSDVYGEPPPGGPDRNIIYVH